MIIKPNRTIIVLILVLLLFCACGQAPAEPSGRADTGSYQPRLVFPESAYSKNSVAKDLSGFSCGENGVATVTFNFIVNGKQFGPHTFDCTKHHATITGVPAGKGVIVEVFADDDKQEAVYEGSEVVDILKDQVTKSGAIMMQPLKFTNDFGMEFALIHAANQPFTMGSPIDENGREGDETEHQVTLSTDYYMMVTEVTQVQWRAVWDAADAAGITIPPSRNPSNFANCDDCPVESVNWDDIQQFILALNKLDQGKYDFPREAQWEFAARGGTPGALPTGELTNIDCALDDKLASIAWYCRNANSTTHPVKGKAPNAYGLYDMHGNVWEWCSDWYGAYPTGSVTDPPGASSGDFKVLRGGSWYNYARACRSADRGYCTPGDPGDRNHGFGFRLAAPLFSSSQASR